MDFRLSEQSEAFRTEVRDFLAEHLTPELIERVHRTGVAHDPEFTRAIRDRGWLAPGWPVEYGGQGRDALEMRAFSEEIQRAGAPYHGIGITMLVAWVILQAGTEEQRQELLPKALAAELLFCLGFTEPENGSDAAAARTRATPEGDGWLINGQKMFTTNGHIADYAFLLARTNTEAPKHHSLTTFLVPLQQEGVEIRPVQTLSGERTNIVFYTDVYVPDRLRLGEVDGGWKVMGVALEREHGGGFAGLSESLLEHVESWARGAPGDTSRSRIEDADVRERVGRAAAETEVARLLERRMTWLQATGTGGHAQGSMAKLFSTERLERQAADFVELLGPDGIRSMGDPSAPAGGYIEHALRHAKGTTIYAGTSEIHRNIIAQLGLGLPRPR